MPIAVMTWLIAVHRSAPCALPAKSHWIVPLLQAAIDIEMSTSSVSGTVIFSNVRIA